MAKIASKTSVIFLATILVAGTIALASLSFMVEAQAASNYGLKYEKEYKYEKSYEKPKYTSYNPDYSKSKNSVDINKINHNNINLNLNDIGVNLGSSNNNVNGFSLPSASAAQENQLLTSNSLVNGEITIITLRQ